MTISDYIEETNSAEVRQLLILAHHFLQENLPPFVTLFIKWKIPFYKLHRNFCYLNRHKDHITLGFPHGYKLSPHPKLLGENENLKQIRFLEIYSVKDLYSDLTRQILHEAILSDETFAKNKPRYGLKKRLAF